MLDARNSSVGRSTFRPDSVASSRAPDGDGCDAANCPLGAVAFGSMADAHESTADTESPMHTQATRSCIALHALRGPLGDAKSRWFVTRLLPASSTLNVMHKICQQFRNIGGRYWIRTSGLRLRRPRKGSPQPSSNLPN